MAETHKQALKDGSIEERKTQLMPQSRREEFIMALFNQTPWTLEECQKESENKFHVSISCQEKKKEYTVYVMTVRDEARQPDEYKSQLGTTSFPSKEELENGALVLGIYVLDSNEDPNNALYVSYRISDVDFSSNPSLRGVRTSGLKMARLYGLHDTEYCTIFRRDLLYYYLKNIHKKEIRLNDSKALPNTESLQIIYYGAPGTGKSHRIDQVTTDTNSVRTTFHPDTDYSTFVGAYKPVKGQRPLYGLNQDKTVRLKDGEKALFEDIISYRFVPQAFLKAYCKAWKNQEEPFFLIIEEINRGNCAQIFGDLFQLLDRTPEGYSSYAIEADDDIRRFISEDAPEEYNLSETEIENILKPNGTFIASGDDIKTGKKLVLPPNLHILATMNTSDQSLFPIDSAFKRRWDWQYEPIAEGKNPDGSRMGWEIEFSEGTPVDWWGFVQAINEVIENKIHSEDKKLGYFFCRAKDGKISARMFLSKVIFYLWNDVFRDYGFTENIFKIDGATKPIKYHEFYSEDGSPNEDKLRKFVNNVLTTWSKAKDTHNQDESKE